MSASNSASAQPGIHKAVIPAAGLGTRLRPLTLAIPKELLPVGRRPVLAHIAAELRAAGMTEALFIVSDRKPQIRAFFGDLYSGGADEAHLPPLRCEYAVQTEQRGLGDALLYAEEWVGDSPFVVAFGDCIVEGLPDEDPATPLRRLIETHIAEEAIATVLVESVPWDRVSRYGVIAPQNPLNALPTAPFAARDIIEKPAQENAPSNLVVAARWALEPAIFGALRRIGLDARGERNLTDAVSVLCEEQGGFWAAPLLSGEARRDIGSFETFFAAFVRAALRDSEAGPSALRAMEECLRE